MDNSIVSFYRYLLIKPVSEDSIYISQCVLKNWLRDLGGHLGIDNMRLYLYDDGRNSMRVYQILGEEEPWKGVILDSIKESGDEKAKIKEQSLEKNIYIVEIRSIRENRQFLTLGYLAFYTERYVKEELMLSLDVLCMLYGNYIVKKLMAGQYTRMNNILPRIYKEAASENLPGTKIVRLLSCLHHISAFNYCIFCTVYGNSIFPEYIANNNNKPYICLKELLPWQVPASFIANLANNSINKWYLLSDFPKRIIDFVLYYDRHRRSPGSFTLQLYPIYLDDEIVGLWMFVFSKKNLFKDFNPTSISILEGTFPLLKDSYKYLFQRRFKAMIINPIFQNRDTRVNHDEVFVIMPFSEDWSTEIWEQVLKPAVQEMGMTPIRADDLYGQNIMEDVWQSILKASIIICDTTGRNPNVFYELGIAHTLGKKVLLLTQDIKDIPFDLRALRHIKYQVSISGANRLKDTVKKHIQETLSSN